MNTFPLVLYLVASVAYAIYFARRSEAAGRFATLALVGLGMLGLAIRRK